MSEPSILHPDSAPPSPPPAMPRRRSSTPEPFVLALFWCLWLLGCWSATLLIESPQPAGRLMIHACLAGLLLLWPAYRLSTDPAGAGRADRLAGVLTDWLVLNLVLQAVLWALPLTAGWTLHQTLWLDAALAAWSLLAAALVGWGMMHQASLGRTTAMLLCVLLLVGEPLLRSAWVRLGLPNLGPAGSPLRVSPLAVIQGLTVRPEWYDPRPWPAYIVAVGVAAILAWGVLAVLARR